MKIGTVWLLLLVAGVGVGVFFLTRRSGNATQADEAAGIINSIANLGKGIGAAAGALKDTVNG